MGWAEALMFFAGGMVVRSLRSLFEQTVSQLGSADKSAEILVGFAPKIDKKGVGQFAAQSRTGVAARTKTLQTAQEQINQTFVRIMRGVGPKQTESKLPGFSAVESDLDEIRQRKLDSSWLTNMVRMSATPSMVRSLARNDEVAFIIPNSSVRAPNLVEATSTNLQTLHRREQNKGQTWGLSTLKVDQIWDEGFTGEGIKIGHLDTGVDASHPDLADRIADFALFDPRGELVKKCDPFDSGTHGTHTAGTIVGGHCSGVSIGVAPDAKLVSGAVLLGGAGTLWQIIKGMEWLAGKRLRIINLSLGGAGYLPDYEYALERLTALGIFASCSIGNEGLAVTGSPGNMVKACGVGSLEPSKEVSDFSGGGSITYYDSKHQRIEIQKPDVVAPGGSVYSALPGSQWSYKNGTSMAAPHVAGVAALLLQARPKASLSSLQDALYGTARHPNKMPYDSRFGQGIVSPVRALKHILS